MTKTYYIPSNILQCIRQYIHRVILKQCGERYDRNVYVSIGREHRFLGCGEELILEMDLKEE